MERFRERRVRVWVVVISLLGLFAGLVGRLCWIQGKDAPVYRAIADLQHRVSVPVAVPRGAILDRSGRKLAHSVRTSSIFIDPRQVCDRIKTSRRLSELLGVDGDKVFSRLGGAPEPVCLKWDVTEEDQRKLHHSPLYEKVLSPATFVADGALWARAELIKDKPAASVEYARALGRKRKAVLEELDGPREFVWVKRKISEEERRRVAGDKEVEGIGIVSEYRRSYPHGDLAAQLVGFVGLDENGLEGIELAMDSSLSGENGFLTFERDAAGHYISNLGLPRRDPVPGSDVELTLDAVIQQIVEEELKAMCEKWGPRGAMAIVLDPRTGDILAAASVPSFDPNRYAEYRSRDLDLFARARYVVDMWEPGSIMKPFVLAAALTEGLITEETVFFCENGCWLIGSRRFHDVHAYGNLSAAEIIIKSSNVGAAKIGTRVGAVRLYSYLRRFGFGQPTGYAIQGETPGRLASPVAWTSFSLPSVCVGQEICVSALQMTLGFATIANDGVRMRPRLVRRMMREDGSWQENPPREVCRVIPASIAAQVRRLLCRAVEEGTGRPARQETYSLGGKTGTAQKLNPDGRSYSRSKSICSFVAMAPADRPRIVVMVTADEPTKPVGRYFGGTVAAPAVGRIINRTLAYLGVAPDKTQTLARLGLSETPAGVTQ